MDVLELDAASRTKVDEMRELLDGVRYAPVEARYKVYIIDEVHMLSTAAFNALLKTLEEPPPHAKFIFATTEIRKVPVTILSRCQRFDLRRVEPEVIAANLARIAEAEGVRDRGRRAGADRPGRRGLGARRPVAARPGAGAGRGRRAWSPRPSVRDMLGLADRAQTIELFEKVRARRGRPGDRGLPHPLRLRRRPGDGGRRPAGALPRRQPWPRRSARTRWCCPRTRRSAWRPSARRSPAGSLSRLWQMLLRGLRRGAPRARSGRGGGDGADPPRPTPPTCRARRRR